MKVVGSRKLIMCVLGLSVFLIISLSTKRVNYLSLGSGILMVIGPAVIANFGEYLYSLRKKL